MVRRRGNGLDVVEKRSGDVTHGKWGVDNGQGSCLEVGSVIGVECSQSMGVAAGEYGDDRGGRNKEGEEEEKGEVPV
jgi:hypothetical protein